MPPVLSTLRIISEDHPDQSESAFELLWYEHTRSATPIKLMDIRNKIRPKLEELAVRLVKNALNEYYKCLIAFAIVHHDTIAGIMALPMDAMRSIAEFMGPSTQIQTYQNATWVSEVLKYLMKLMHEGILLKDPKCSDETQHPRYRPGVFIYTEEFELAVLRLSRAYSVAMKSSAPLRGALTDHQKRMRQMRDSITANSRALTSDNTPCLHHIDMANVMSKGHYRDIDVIAGQIAARFTPRYWPWSNACRAPHRRLFRSELVVKAADAAVAAGDAVLVSFDYTQSGEVEFQWYMLPESTSNELMFMF